MDIILVPGFWLDATSWEDVTPALEEAGHRAHPLTLPGLESVDADRSGIGLRHHVDAVVAAIDRVSEESGEKVVLVANSGGGPSSTGPSTPGRIVWRARSTWTAPARPRAVSSRRSAVRGRRRTLAALEIFEEADLIDLTDDLRERFRSRSIPEPAGVMSDPQRLSDERRYDVPATVIACQFPSSLLREWIAGGHPFVAELARIRDVEYVDLPTGHWPQFTKPAELGR